MGKRGIREGSIRKKRRRRKDGTWYEWYEGEVMVGYRPDGTRDRRIVTGATRQEVAKKIADLVAREAKGMLPPADRVTLRQYLEAWLAHHKRFGGRRGQGLRPNTYRGYKDVIEHHIVPAIGDVVLQKLGPDHLKHLYRAMSEKKVRGGRPLSRRMAALAHVILHAALEDAVLEGKLARNPCDRVADPPRVVYRAKDRPRLAWQDVPRVLKALEGSRWHLPVWLAMATGLRRGELLGLTWAHVDLDRAVVRVRQQWNKLADGSWGLCPPKSEHSVRDIPLPADLVAALRRHKQNQKVVSLQHFVFDGGDGRPYSPAELSHVWGELRRKLRLPENMHFHDLRGSYITWLAQRKVNVKAAAQLAGHANVQTVLELYQAVTEDMAEEAARAVEGMARPVPE